MKTLVITVIIAMTSVVNAVSGNRTNQFAYNTETSEGRVETQTVFKVENAKYLHRHLKYNYIYDNAGRVSRKEVLKWNEATQSFEKHHALNFFYTDDVTVEYAAWNEQKNAYADVEEKAVYQTAGGNLSYQCYQWNPKESVWNLTTAHSTNGENSRLLADITDKE